MSELHHVTWMRKLATRGVTGPRDLRLQQLHERFNESFIAFFKHRHSADQVLVQVHVYLHGKVRVRVVEMRWDAILFYWMP